MPTSVAPVLDRYASMKVIWRLKVNIGMQLMSASHVNIVTGLNSSDPNSVMQKVYRILSAVDGAIHGLRHLFVGRGANFPRNFRNSPPKNMVSIKNPVIAVMKRAAVIQV